MWLTMVLKGTIVEFECIFSHLQPVSLAPVKNVLILIKLKFERSFFTHIYIADSVSQEDVD